jgi:transcriptional regulator with XRE-family HTH domain
MLKKRRLIKHITELELANKLGVTEGYISKLENHPEKCNPTVNLILKLSYALKIKPERIFIFFIKDKKYKEH